jgi:hypothetical protein
MGSGASRLYHSSTTGKSSRDPMSRTQATSSAVGAVPTTAGPESNSSKKADLSAIDATSLNCSASGLGSALGSPKSPMSPKMLLVASSKSPRASYNANTNNMSTAGATNNMSVMNNVTKPRTTSPIKAHSHGSSARSPGNDNDANSANDDDMMTPLYVRKSLEDDSFNPNNDDELEERLIMNHMGMMTMSKMGEDGEDPDGMYERYRRHYYGNERDHDDLGEDNNNDLNNYDPNYEEEGNASNVFAEMDQSNAEMFAVTAMSLGLENDDLLFNLMYFGGSEAASALQGSTDGHGLGLGGMVNTAMEETVALYSEHNTPYKLRPLAQDSVSELPVSVMTNDADAKMEDHEKECLVCRDNIEVGEEFIKLPACTHMFHRECIYRWLQMVSVPRAVKSMCSDIAFVNGL